MIPRGFPSTLNFQKHLALEATPAHTSMGNMPPSGTALITSCRAWKTAYGFFPCQAWNSWKVGAEHCVGLWGFHSIEHSDRKQKTRVSVLVLPLTSSVFYLPWEDFQSLQRTYPKSDCCKAEDGGRFPRTVYLQGSSIQGGA